MKIGEVPVNAMIQIRVMRGEKKFECMGAVVAAREDGLYLAPIKHEGQMIDFSAENIQIFAFYVDKNRQDTYQHKLCHLLVTKRDSVRVNRRGEPRIRTEMNATVRTLADDKERERQRKHGDEQKPAPQASDHASAAVRRYPSSVRWMLRLAPSACIFFRR